MQGLRDEVVKIMDNENFREITFAGLVYSIQRSTNADLGGSLTIVKALFDEMREKLEEQSKQILQKKRLKRDS